MKKFLFPFSWEKYKFLEKKRWHRLLKIMFFMLVGVGLLSSIIIYPNIKTKPGEEFIDYQQTIADLSATVLARPKATPIEIKEKFPEYKNIDIETFSKFKTTIEEDPNITIEDAMSKFPELTEAKVITTDYLWYYTQIAIYTILTTYILWLGLQLIYFKGIIYIIYWDKKNG